MFDALMLLLPILAFFIGIAAALVGIGGGVFMAPILILIYGFLPKQASGTSITAIIFTSISSTIIYKKQRRIDYVVGLILAATTIPGAFLGSYATSIVPSQTLGIVFAVFLLFVALRMLIGLNQEKPRKENKESRGWSRKIIDRDGIEFLYQTDIRLTPFFGFSAGFFSGLLGIGGGSLLVPAMHLGMGVPMHITVATSMFIMIFTSISGSITHFYLGNVSFEHALLLALGVIFGARIGAKTAKKVSARGLRKTFGIILILISLRMFLKFVGLAP